LLNYAHHELEFVSTHALSLSQTPPTLQVYIYRK
jgi:hypothetical protein